MKTTLFALFAILIGIALGIGVARFRMTSSPNDAKPALPSPARNARRASPMLQGPKVVVDRERYEFGTLDIAATGRHDFVFRNVGDSPLRLVLGETSCRCTVSELERSDIPPGGSTKVALTWKAKDAPGPYEQTAAILTNDPARPRVHLTISGQISAPVQLAPPDLTIQLSTGETAAADAKLLCFLDKPLRLSGREFSNAATARCFDVTSRPLTPEELKENVSARSGVLLRVTVHPGLPEGTFSQKITFQTGVTESPTATLTIRGLVVGEIAVAGPGWNADRGILNLGTIPSREGANRRLLLVVRGPSREKVTFEVVRVVPDSLRVSLGKPMKIGGGVVVETPLAIEIPPDSPTVNRLGSSQTGLGEIILKTTHARVPEFRIPVRVAIERD